MNIRESSHSVFVCVCVFIMIVCLIDWFVDEKIEENHNDDGEKHSIHLANKQTKTNLVGKKPQNHSWWHNIFLSVYHNDAKKDVIFSLYFDLESNKNTKITKIQSIKTTTTTTINVNFSFTEKDEN